MQLPLIVVLLAQLLPALERCDITLAQGCDGLVALRMRDTDDEIVVPFGYRISELVLGPVDRSLLVPGSGMLLKVPPEVTDCQGLAE